MKYVILFSAISLLFTQTTVTVYNYSTKNKVSSFERDFIESCIQLYNKRYKETLKLNFVGVEKFKDGFTHLNTYSSQTSPALYINTVSYTKDRHKVYDYSPPYLLSSFGILSTKGSSKVNSYEKNKRYGAEKGTLEIELLTRIQKDVGFQLVTYNTLQDLVTALKKGEIDYFASDYLVSQVFDLQVNFLVDNTIKDRLCILYPKNSFNDFKTKFNAIVSYYVQSPTYYNKVRSYFGNDGVSFIKKMTLLN